MGHQLWLSVQSRPSLSSREESTAVSLTLIAFFGLWKRNRLAARMHLVQAFRRFGPDVLPAAFAHVAAKEEARRRDEQARLDMVEIARAGCGRRQRL